MDDESDLPIRLRSHLANSYRLTIDNIAPLQPGNTAVYSVEGDTRPSWVARIFPPTRPLERVQGDADTLRDLEQPCDSHGATRDGGAWGGLPNHEGLPREDIAAATEPLDEIAGRVPAPYAYRLESLQRQVATIDDLDGLPVALLHPDPMPVNALVQPNGEVAFVDWASAGRGPRIAAFGWMLNSALLDRTKLAALVHGYTSYVHLQDEELERLPDAIRLRALFFACWYFHVAVVNSKAPKGRALRWCEDEDLACSAKWRTT